MKIRILAAIMILPFTLKAGEHVIVLHGLARSPASMARMSSALEKAGFSVANVSYPSRSGVIHTAHPFIMKNRKSISQTIHFLQTGSFARPEGAADASRR